MKAQRLCYRSRKLWIKTYQTCWNHLHAWLDVEEVNRDSYLTDSFFFCKMKSWCLCVDPSEIIIKCCQPDRVTLWKWWISPEAYFLQQSTVNVFYNYITETVVIVRWHVVSDLYATLKQNLTSWKHSNKVSLWSEADVTQAAEDIWRLESNHQCDRRWFFLPTL